MNDPLQWVRWLDIAQQEILLFAAVGLLLLGLDDILVDILYFLRRGWRRMVIYSRHARMTAATLPPPRDDRPLAIFVPAWDEAAIIGDTLRGMEAAWGAGITPFHIFVGTYPNDAGTAGAVLPVAQDSEHVTLVIHDRPGPSTKADCLNQLWKAMQRAEKETGTLYKAVVLHDAEDVVHPDELRLLSTMIDRADMVQTPVRPLLNQQSRWIAGHYADEFAEAHAKFLITREAIGASVPSAGVGCALGRAMLARIAGERDGLPFDPASLTEDYEIGLRIRELQGSAIFVRMRDSRGDLICTQEHFPDTLEAAVRQKARWLTGIGLAGWDRMGWHGGWRERWMRFHDRKSSLAALVTFTAYVALILYALRLAVYWRTGVEPMPFPPALRIMLLVTAAMLIWRLAMRALFSASAYGWRQGLHAIPRAIVANIIAMMAARRALAGYIAMMLHGRLIWDKTPHPARPAGGTGI